METNEKKETETENKEGMKERMELKLIMLSRNDSQVNYSPDLIPLSSSTLSFTPLLFNLSVTLICHSRLIHE